MSDISNEMMVRTIDKIQGASIDPRPKPGLIRAITVGTLFGAAVALIGLSAPIPQEWLIGAAAVAGGALNYRVSRRIMSERIASDGAIALEKYLVIIEHKERSDPKALPFLVTFRRVLEKRGITPKRSMAIIEDLVTGRESTENAYYIIKAILTQLESMKTEVNQ